MRLAMRRYGVMAVVVLALAGLGATSASAANQYDGRSPYRTYYYANGQHSYRCADSGRIVSAQYLTAGSARRGAIQLVRSRVCDTYWARLYLYRGAFGTYATAKLMRFYRGGRAGLWTCADNGGNGNIPLKPPTSRTWCHTGMIYAPSSSVTLEAYGVIREWDEVRRVWVTYNQALTKRCNASRCYPPRSY